MAYHWFLCILIIAILFLTLGFENNFGYRIMFTGIGVGYIKDRTQDFMNFLNRWS